MTLTKAAQSDLPFFYEQEILFDPNSSHFTFLNNSVGFDLQNADWQASGQQRLWQYHLHYFDVLRQSGLEQSIKNTLISSWINKNPQGKEPAWEPYTTSLRIVNWCFYFSLIEKQPANKNNQVMLDVWAPSLFTQVRWLRRNLELHILANHYFENLKALLVASIYFKQILQNTIKEVDEWLAYACVNLFDQLDEQFFADGGHYERSPYYHVRMLQNCIELRECVKRYQIGSLFALLEKLETVIDRGRSFLVGILNPHNGIPLFNDSVDISQSKIFDLFGEQVNRDIGQIFKEIVMPESGIYGFRNSSHWLTINAGAVGPSYQPGHTHCDRLSFELYIAGQPVVTNTGVLEYQPGENRKHMRSTAAHSTFQLGNDEQSEVWGEFRVARRAEVDNIAHEMSASNYRFSAQLKGFFNLGPVQHRRQISADFEGSRIRKLTVTDHVLESRMALKSQVYRAYLHLHPSLAIVSDSNGIVIVNQSGRRLLRICTDNDSKISVSQTTFHPQFGLTQTRETVDVVSSKPNMRFQLLVF